MPYVLNLNNKPLFQTLSNAFVLSRKILLVITGWLEPKFWKISWVMLSSCDTHESPFSKECTKFRGSPEFLLKNPWFSWVISDPPTKLNWVKFLYPRRYFYTYYMYVYVYVCVYVHVHVHVHVHVRMHACTHVCMYACMHVCMGPTEFSTLPCKQDCLFIVI